MVALEKLKREEEEYIKHRDEDKQEKILLKKEDPAVEYKRRLVERFSYKNTDMIKRIYAENQVRFSCQIVIWIMLSHAQCATKSVYSIFYHLWGII